MMISRPVAHLLLSVLVVTASLQAEQRAFAQAQPEPDRPRLVLNTLGPSSRTRTVAFSNDSTRLFAAGFDKTIHVWDVGWNNQQGPIERDRATPIHTLRWEIARANRGLINAMAVSPNAERIAIAGQSARGANGDIILMDVDRYEVEGSLPPIRDEQTSLPGHTQSVTSLSFSPDGRRLVSSGSDGAVWLWTQQPGPPGNWTPTPIQSPRGSQLFNEQPVLFVSNDQFVISRAIDPNVMDAWQLVLYSVAAPQRPIAVLPQEHAGRVSTLVRAADGRTWASADNSGRVFLWSDGPQAGPRILRDSGREPSSMVFGPGGRTLAVANYLDRRSQSVVELWDTASGQLIDQVMASPSEHTNTVTISPDGQYLATHADDSQEVWVFRLTGPDGSLLPQPLSGQPPIRLRSRARRVTHVAFKQPQAGAPPTYEIGFSTTPNRQIHSGFHLSAPDLYRLEQPVPPEQYITADAFAGGWQAAPANNNSVVQLIFNGNVVGNIPLNAKRQGEFEGYYCIIPDAQRRPYAIAIGTTNQNGIYVYSLPYQNQPTRLLRYFRDHNGEVLSLGVSHDGRFLASGAEDQTIKIWSLEGLSAVSPTFPFQSAWGADFRLENGRLVVRNVLNMGIAFGRELREGDVVTSLHTALAGTQNNPAQIKATLDQHPLWETTIFTVNRGGQQLQLKPTVPGWEPLMTLLVDNGGEWALFTPEGYYDASVAEGQLLFGWQINQGRNFTPRFLPAENLQKDFERPDLMQRILTAGSVVDALLGNNEPVPADFVQNIAEKAAEIPQVKIVEPRASESFGPGEEITVKAEITTPPGVDPKDFNVRATLGGRFIGEPTQDTSPPPAADRPTTRVLEFKTQPQDRLNRIQIFAVDSKEESLLNAKNSTATTFNRGQPAEPERLRKLHILALASDKYDGKYWAKLEYPLKDLDEIVSALKDKRSEKFYQRGQISELVNTDITPQSVSDQISIIKDRLSDVEPYDVVFVYLSGHGKAVDNLYHYVPPMLSDADEDVRKKGIPWTLLRGIADLQCNVIWMLDTCESGKILNKSGVREMSKLSMVVAASDDDAFEGNYRGGHGAFTASILDGLDGRADGVEADEGEVEGIADDGVVTVAELVTFVKESVYTNTNRNQEPVVSPTDLVDSPGTIRLAEVASTTASNP